MEIIDVIILLIVFGFTLIGLWSGFIRSIGSLSGFFLGIFIASRIFDSFDVSISGRIFIFILTYVLVGQITGLVFYIIEKIFNIISIIPFTKTINRLLGGLLGLLEGACIVAGAVFIVHYFNVQGWLNPFSESAFAPYALKFAYITKPFITDILKQVL